MWRCYIYFLFELVTFHRQVIILRKGSCSRQKPFWIRSLSGIIQTLPVGVSGASNLISALCYWTPPQTVDPQSTDLHQLDQITNWTEGHQCGEGPEQCVVYTSPEFLLFSRPLVAVSQND